MSEHNHDNCGCGHDHNHDHDHEDGVIIFTDENDVEREMELIYMFEDGNQQYAVLLERNNPEEGAVIFRYDEEGDESFLTGIESQEEWDRVVTIYNQILEEENAE
ncbi:DUF1292 domain-containing protein [Paenibacillus larvae]|jgi:uncharacterized protein YrzB (UPF0473 family)|uniref:DUF1292 domain-containing protein n=4 Tax=Paenibacillus larvae TaxID=1464 RepID=V9W561_9BACL|nr:DUF1292 domain-containing protein [Paenibacillus larvae]AHD06176.1 hypothetical protein ERIC2_c23870 [Paenibacillus larvae subsp. larvae DSM 25430]AQR77267.1 DUF1292 domain-containing protein [Paenibacillus larvae subsp. larvae]AQT83798.1 DUF1292 domain-containing protein [Paenibacillus larvae subsp. pulvifaciens]AQZ45234.1 DUF1292 domain-containing protein [Paenibacillus larvae subsp. pulvifaciens]ARF69758.1 DUF1292 domain-containing protein [Paenibacillus larvae subsp. pulvifaciens]